jgi:hypothetical protein
MKHLTGLLILCAGALISSPVLSQQLATSELPQGVALLNPNWETFVESKSVKTDA